MQELVKVLAKALVENPDAVEVEAVEEEDRTVLKLHVAQEDMGRVIGKQGRIAKAIRTIVKSAATRENKKVTVDID
ncbi:MAG: KH domain-containing protein [Selenomonadaceae bacterium]|nr:KH domain-containing protein [Selenomonadaceae bacterium]